MKRRDLLAGWLGAPAAAWLAGPADAAAPVPASMTWLAPPNRYVITVDGPTVTCACRPDDAPPGEGNDTPPPEAGAAIATLGAAGAQPGWRAVAWHWHDRSTLQLRLRATDGPLRAIVTFAADRADGVLLSRTLLLNSATDAPVELTGTLAFRFAIHEPVERLLYLTGAWLQEGRVNHGTPGELPLRLESRAGKTGFAFQPYVALSGTRSTYVCELFWSGNWALDIAQTGGVTTLRGGLNDWAFRHVLRPGESLALPAAVIARAPGGLNAATRRLHDFRRIHRPNPDRPIPVQFNSWYPYAGEPSAETMLPLIPRARQLGCEVFVVDAGWYRTDQGETDADWAGRTGDWRVSHRRFPNGLHEVADHCTRSGLGFGLWFEPEVIGPGSSIRRDHPEWLHHIDGAPPPENRRAVLNLGVPAAWHHVFDRVSAMLSALGVRWMKWDFNADPGAGGWAPGLSPSLTGHDPLVAHYLGLYRLQDAIRRAFPDLVLEMCASGGGRMDGAILSHAHVNWISDQIGPLHKLAIHFGTGLAHPAVECNDWLVAWPPGAAPGYDDKAKQVDLRGDLAFRLRVAMLGSFGFSARLDRWSEADIALAAAHTGFYRRHLRALIHHGEQYHLTRAPPADGNGDWAAIWFVAANGGSGALFAFRLAGESATRSFSLPGLAAARRYQVRPFGDAPGAADGASLARGYPVTLAEKFSSALVLFTT